MPRSLFALVLGGLSACCLSTIDGQSSTGTGTSGTGTSGALEPPVASLLAEMGPANQSPQFAVGYGMSDGIGPDGGCVGATSFVGNCCYVPPPPPAPPGGPGYKPWDGGPAFIDLNLGTLTFSDLTSNEVLGTDLYGNIIVGPGYAIGYPNFAIMTSWRAGDVLSVSGVGGDAGGFMSSAPAVALPGLTLPASISRSTDLTLSWTPDPNATVFKVRLQVTDLQAQPEVVSHGSLACAVPDSAGTLTIDASLLSSFAAGDTVYCSSASETASVAQTALGPVQFITVAGSNPDDDGNAVIAP